MLLPRRRWPVWQGMDSLVLDEAALFAGAQNSVSRPILRVKIRHCTISYPFCFPPPSSLPPPVGRFPCHTKRLPRNRGAIPVKCRCGRTRPSCRCFTRCCLIVRPDTPVADLGHISSDVACACVCARSATSTTSPPTRTRTSSPPLKASSLCSSAKRAFWRSLPTNAKCVFVFVRCVVVVTML